MGSSSTRAWLDCVHVCARVCMHMCAEYAHLCVCLCVFCWNRHGDNMKEGAF